MSRGSWTRRRELVSRAELAAGALGVLLLTVFDDAWWLRQMLAPAFGLAAGVAFLAGVLFLGTGDAGSGWLAFGVAGVSGGVGLWLRPPRCGPVGGVS